MLSLFTVIAAVKCITARNADADVGAFTKQESVLEARLSHRKAHVVDFEDQRGFQSAHSIAALQVAQCRL